MNQSILITNDQRHKFSVWAWLLAAICALALLEAAQAVVHRVSDNGMLDIDSSNSNPYTRTNNIPG